MSTRWRQPNLWVQNLRAPDVAPFTQPIKIAADDIPVKLDGAARVTEDAILSGSLDEVGIAQGFVLDPSLPETWKTGCQDLTFPRFATLPPGA